MAHAASTSITRRRAVAALALSRKQSIDKPAATQHGRRIMAQKKAASEGVAKSATPDPTELVKTVEIQVEAIAERQREFFNPLAKMNERWLSRARAEARLATDLGRNLSSARSLPDVVEAYRQWMMERTKTLVEDSQQFVADCQRFMQETARLLPKGWSAGST